MHDVIVVGAGFAGLAAAAALEMQGRSVLVLEARDRIGGKVTSGLDELGRRVDLGGQWVCDDMTAVLDLICHHGLTLVAPDRRGRAIAHPVGDLDAIDAAFAEAVRQTGDTSFGEVARGYPADVRVGVRAGAQSTMCVDPDRFPAWHIADMFARAPIQTEELQYYVAETMHELALRMAASLATTVRTGVRVTSLHRSEDRIAVTAAPAEGGDEVVEARHVVLAVPPQVVPRIDHSPPLPDTVARACQAFAPGQVCKVLVRYDRPFWNDAGLDGTVQFTDPTTLYVSATTDAEGAGLVAFVGGPLAEHVRTLASAEGRAVVLGLLADALGPDALRPISWIARDWPPDDLGAGGYQSVLVDADARDAHDVLRQGLDRVAFASTEIAALFPGYIDGAIRAGRAAAANVTPQG